ncbi:NYN domain-containing protein [Parafrigoribacterium humi]|uniref:NYN domain-containing protein n=1 Tax=Parafrigoribacterium humi TaxID=3144664 RepID=UPI0032EE343A
MAEPTEGRVAVYIDFDNIVISRYDQKHKRRRGQQDSLRDITAESLRADPALAARLAEARVDLGAVLDFASSFGSIIVSRAYADWSIEVNAAYRNQLMERAVELVQLFPAVRPAKNGADIRLAVDVVEDLFRLPDITHVVIVAGDSDYIALAQRCKRLGRYVVGIGVAGSTSKFLASACDEFADYDALPGLTDDDDSDLDEAELDADADDGTASNSEGTATSESSQGGTATKRGRSTGRRATTATATAAASDSRVKPAVAKAATDLLRRALRLGQAKEDVDWIASSAVKNQMLRMDPSFQESALGYKTFTDFVKSRHNIVELKEEGQLRLIRLRVSREVEK